VMPSPACVFCDGCDDETATHFSLECPAFNCHRQPLLDDLSVLVGPAKYSAWAALSGEERLNGLLGDAARLPVVGRPRCSWE
jgi:hypothetical protein